MIRLTRTRKLDHMWSYVGSGCYDSIHGMRIHVGGLLIGRKINIKDTIFEVDQFTCPIFSKSMVIMGNNRKRALMLYAEYLTEMEYGYNQ